MFVTPSRPLLSGILGLALLALAPLAGRRGTINAQSPPLDVETSGRRYVVAFPDTTQNHPPGGSVAKFRDEFDLFIYSATDSNRVTIVQPDGNSTKLTLRGGAFQVIPITSSPVADRINVAQRRAISVDATAPVVLYCYMATRFGMEAWTPIPVEMWGTEYSAAALPSGSVADVGYVAESKVFSTVKPAPSEILVIAAYDNTKVAIRPSAAQHLAGTTAASVEVTLRAGECYQVQSDAHIDASGEGEQTDLGGVVVRADKPIGVISGNTRTLVRQDQTGLLGNVYKGMVMEWLPPRDQQGTEFVYLPSWDKHRPGIDARAERAGEYVRAYSGSQPLSYTSLDNGAVTGHAMTHDSLSELLLPAVDAVYLRSQKPMQAFMHSPSVLQLVAKVTCFLGYPPCQIYAAWAPYMVEMTPREQWGSFAPYYAPTVPAGMEHNINVVTDTASARHIFTEEGDLFPFTRRIPGTDLIWGSRAVVPGVSHYLVGVGGARFYGYVYGTLAGREHYSPTRTRKSDDPEIASGGEEPGAEQLMAGTYEEDNALSYAYPLSPRRSVLAPPDSLEVVRGRACGTLLLQVRTLNPRPSGIRSIELDRGMSANARLEFVEPLAAADITGSSSAYVKVVPVDESKGIVARIAITDRTGRITYVDHVYDPPRVDVSARAIDFGALSVGSSRDTVITFTNTASYDLPVKGVTLVSGGDNGFSIVATEPAGPAASPVREIALPPGGTMRVRLRSAMRLARQLDQDSLRVAFGCTSMSLPLRASNLEPSITVNDLDFGAFAFGTAPRTMEARLCNSGSGTLTLDDAGSDSVVAWGDGDFTVPPQELAMLKGRSLAPGECVMLHVTFAPSTPGGHRAVARFLANTRQAKDTSVWRAMVEPSSGVEGDALAGYALAGAVPNPTGGRTSIAYTLGHAGHVTLEIRDALGGLVATLVDGTMGAGEHRAEWDARGVAAGVYYCRIVSGGWRGSAAVVVTR